MLQSVAIARRFCMQPQTSNDVAFDLSCQPAFRENCQPPRCITLQLSRSCKLSIQERHTSQSFESRGQTDFCLQLCSIQICQPSFSPTGTLESTEAHHLLFHPHLASLAFLHFWQCLVAKPSKSDTSLLANMHQQQCSSGCFDRGNPDMQIEPKPSLALYLAKRHPGTYKSVKEVRQGPGNMAPCSQITALVC